MIEWTGAQLDGNMVDRWFLLIKSWTIRVPKKSVPIVNSVFRKLYRAKGLGRNENGQDCHRPTKTTLKTNRQIVSLYICYLEVIGVSLSFYHL